MSSQPVGSSPEGEAGVPLGDGQLAPAGRVDGGGDGIARSVDFQGAEITVTVDIAWLSPASRDYVASRLLDALEGSVASGHYTLRWG